mgnify:CR=1 FL=1
MKKQGDRLADEYFPVDGEIFVDNAGDIVPLVVKIAAWRIDDRVVSFCFVSPDYCEV